MWEYIDCHKLYAKLNNKHCSIWYDSYIHEWRWILLEFTVDSGIVSVTGVNKSLSAAMLIAERSANRE
jgi:hypothetical protein